MYKKLVQGSYDTWRHKCIYCYKLLSMFVNVRSYFEAYCLDCGIPIVTSDARIGSLLVSRR